MLLAGVERRAGALLKQSGSYNRALHLFISVTAGLTFLLLIAGALVTSNQAGLSVPDWPTSFGHIFKIPPMVGGVKYEHTHRMIAELVGLCTIALAVWTQLADHRKWMRLLGWIALVGVIVQGVLGGLTVKMLLPWYVSTAHAAVAQTFFCLLVLMTLCTSKSWIEERGAGSENAGNLFSLTLASLAVLYLQLFFGAAFRHGGMSIVYHIFNAILVTAVLAVTSIKGMIIGRAQATIRKPALWMHGLLWVQIALGIAAYFTRVKWGAEAPQPLPSMVASTVAHVAVGALLLASTFVLAVEVRRISSTVTLDLAKSVSTSSEVTA